jgi:hypothetical protein
LLLCHWVLLHLSHKVIHPILIRLSCRLSLKLRGAAWCRSGDRISLSACLDVVKKVVDFKGTFCILFLILFHEEIEVSLQSSLEFQKVDSIFALLYFFKFNIPRENVEAVNFEISVCIAPLELLHTLRIFDYLDDSLSPLGLDQFSIEGHLTSLYFDQSFVLLLCHAHELLHLLRVHIHLIINYNGP